MTYQTFKQQIRQSLQDAFGSDVSIILQDILKNNNTHLDGLTVLTPGCNISPTIYLNDYFHAYENAGPFLISAPRSGTFISRTNPPTVLIFPFSHAMRRFSPALSLS